MFNGLYRNMFSRTGLNQLLNNGHIHDITSFNCAKDSANWYGYFKDMGI